MRLVKVTWNDAWANKEDEVSLEEVKRTHKPVVVSTIGWLLVDDEEGVSVANETYEDNFRGRTFILRSLIMNMEDVVKVKARRVKKERKEEQS